MIDYNRIYSRVMTIAHVDRDTAIESVSSAWITADKSRPDNELASYLIKTAVLRTKSYDTNTILISELYQDSEDDGDGYDPYDIAVSPEPIQEDHDYIKELVTPIPTEYRYSTIAVIYRLLKVRQRKPLTVEMTRQYIKAAGIPNTSEQARQVFTYLTTLKR